MPSSRVSLDAEVCPVTDDILGSLYRASEHGLPELVATVSSDVRAMLALFCHRRAHLHSMSLVIAATCSEKELVDQGGALGASLYTMSREGGAKTASPAQGGRRSITLSTQPLSAVPAMDDLDDEDETPAA